MGWMPLHGGHRPQELVVGVTGDVVGGGSGNAPDPLLPNPGAPGKPVLNPEPNPATPVFEGLPGSFGLLRSKP